MRHSITKSMVALLALVYAMTPYAIDSYLPAIPTIADDFDVGTAMVSITVSMYVFGMALGQLIGGPASDRYGRKSVMVAGLLIFACCSVFLAMASNLEQFWLWRVLQSIGGGIAVVCVPAIIRDKAQGREAAKLFSLVMLIMMIAPSVAPSVGTLILYVANWHWIFISSGLFAFLVALLALKVMPKQASVPLKAQVNSGFLSIIKSRKALGYLFAQSCSYAVLMTFITNAPFAYIDHFGVSEQLFSILFIANVAGVIMINRLNAYLLHKLDPENILVGFLGLQVLGTIILLASVLFAPSHLWLAVSGFVICMAAMGGTVSNANVCFLKHFATNAGRAQAVLGACQFFSGAAISAVAALLSQHSLLPMSMIMCCCAVLALLNSVKANQLNRLQSVAIASQN